MKQVRHFNSGGEAAVFGSKFGVAARWTEDGWVVEWDDGEPEPASSFDGIVSRNGGEPAPEIPYTGGKSIKDSFLDVLASKETVDALGHLIASASQPAEIVQRQRVVGLSVADMEDETLTVTMETRFFTVTKEQAQLFKVGSEIEVVLRPAPLA